MEHKLPELPFTKDALTPFISAETLEYHWGKHHKTYVDNLNKLIVNTEYEKLSLEEIVRTAPAGGIFNNAAQIWNHSFYWNCLKPKAGGAPTGAIATAITKNFGTFEVFKEKFTTAATTLFGSGWAWLVKNSDGTISIEQAPNAGNPLKDGKKPLLTCDVWEHAYYIDYRNARAKYVEAFWNILNWQFVDDNLK
jgi:superoxide dismutase, Fe-Mn family